MYYHRFYLFVLFAFVTSSCYSPENHKEIIVVIEEGTKKDSSLKDKDTSSTSITSSHKGVKKLSLTRAIKLLKYDIEKKDTKKFLIHVGYIERTIQNEIKITKNKNKKSILRKISIRINRIHVILPNYNFKLTSIRAKKLSKEVEGILSLARKTEH